MSKESNPAASSKTEKAEAWTPPDACPACGNEMIIPVYERHSIACPECRQEIAC